MRDIMRKKGGKAAIAGQADEFAVSRLDELLGESTGKKRLPRWPFFAAGTALLCGAGILIFVSQRGVAAKGETTYREYTVERGNIIVGDTESSSISLNRETVTFPVSTSVEEVYVKAGSYVEKGAPLMKLDLEQIQVGLASYELELEQAGLELEQAKLTQTKGELEAEQKYETSKLSGELSEQTETLSLMELEQTYASAVNSLNEAMESYDDYMLSYYSDYSELTSLYSVMSGKQSAYTAAAQSLYSYLSSQGGYSDIAALQAAISAKQAEADSKQAQIDNMLLIDPAADTSALRSELSVINTEKQRLSGILTQAQTYNSASAAAQSEYEAADKAYDAAAESFEKTYGTLNYSTDYNTNIENLRLKVEKAQLSLEKARLSIDTGTQSAEQKADTAKTEANAAGTELELKEMELQQAVDAAQEAYDALETEIAEIKESMSEDGVVFSPCSGMVASVAFEAGDSFEVTYNPMTEAVVEQTLLTITDIANVYVPITISEEDILNVSIGQTASVTMTAFSGQTFEAEVDTISVESSRSGAATVSYTVNVRFCGTNTKQMLEGMSAEVTLVQRQALDVLYINSACVTNVRGRASVLVAGEDGAPVEREVTTGFSDGRYVEILSGLSEGETVLAESSVQQQ